MKLFEFFIRQSNSDYNTLATETKVQETGAERTTSVFIDEPSCFASFLAFGLLVRIVGNIR